MLRVENHLVDALLEISDGVADDVEVGLPADAQIVADVQIPGLADDRHDRRLGLEQLSYVQIVRCGRIRAASRAERGDSRVLQFELANLGEKLLVAGIGSGPTALDVADAAVIELLRNAELVLERECHVLGLGAVAQRCVI